MTGSGIVGSTLTVQGNAFSVGGSSFVVNGGKIGLLTASPAAVLDVSGDSQFGAGAAKSTVTAGGVALLVQGHVGTSVVIPDQTVFTSSGGAVFVSSDSASSTPVTRWWDNSLSEVMRVRNDGKVGIGLTNPAYKLEVKGSGGTYARINDADNEACIVLMSDNVSENYICSPNGQATMAFSDGGGAYMELSAGGAIEGLIIEGAVNQRPGATLDVNGSAQFGSGATKSTFTAAGQYQGVSGVSALLVGTTDFSVSNGRVGIGVAAPTAALDVQGGGSRFYISTASNMSLGLDGGGGNVYIDGVDSGDNLNFVRHATLRNLAFNSARFYWANTSNIEHGNIRLNTQGGLIIDTAEDTNGGGLWLRPKAATGVTFGSGADQSTMTASGFWQPLAKTKAQIDALTPTAVGQVIYASDTTLPGLCVSTGTAIAQWRKMEGPAGLGCGTNN